MTTKCGIKGSQWPPGIPLSPSGNAVVSRDMALRSPTRGEGPVDLVPADGDRYTATSGCLVFSAVLLGIVLIGSGKLIDGVLVPRQRHHPRGTGGSWAVWGARPEPFPRVVSSHAAADRGLARSVEALESWQVSVTQRLLARQSTCNQPSTSYECAGSWRGLGSRGAVPRVAGVQGPSGSEMSSRCGCVSSKPVYFKGL